MPDIELDLSAFDKPKKKSSGLDLSAFDTAETKAPIQQAVPIVSEPIKPSKQSPYLKGLDFKSVTDAIKADKEPKSNSVIGGIYNTLVDAVGLGVKGVAYAGSFGGASSMGSVGGAMPISTEERVKGAEAISKAAVNLVEKARTESSSKENEQNRSKFNTENGIFTLDNAKALGFQFPSTVASMAAGAATGGASFFAQAVGSSAKELADNPNADKLTENQKIGYIATQATISAVLEKIGIDKVFKSTGISKKVQQKIAAEITEDFIKRGVKATAKEIEEAAMQKATKLATKIKTVGLKTATSFGAEGGTEALQSGASDITKLITNKASGKNIFDEEDIKKNFGKNMLESGLMGGATGGILGGGMSLLSNTNKAIRNEVAKARTPEDIERVRQQIAEQVELGRITPEEAEAAGIKAQQYAEIAAKIPTEVGDDKKYAIIGGIEQRENLKRDIEAARQEASEVDEAFRGEKDAKIELLNGKLGQVNDYIESIVTGEKPKYEKEGDVYYKVSEDGTKKPISKIHYELATAVEEEQSKGVTVIKPEENQPIETIGIGGIENKPETNKSGVSVILPTQNKKPEIVENKKVEILNPTEVEKPTTETVSEVIGEPKEKEGEFKAEVKGEVPDNIKNILAQLEGEEEAPIKIDDIKEGFVLSRGSKEGSSEGFHSIRKNGGEGYAGKGGKLVNSAIKKGAKILKLVSGDSENYSENAKDIEEFYKIFGEEERAKKSEWAEGEALSDITTRLWNNKEAQAKLKKAGIDIVIGDTIDGVDAFVVNKDALEPISKPKAEIPKEQVKPIESKPTKEGKQPTDEGLRRAEAKKVHARVSSMEAPVNDARQIALRYIADGFEKKGSGGFGKDAIEEIAGHVKRARLNTGEKEKLSQEVKDRDYYNHNEKRTLDQIAHDLWERSDQEVSERDIKDALMEAAREHNTRLEAGKAYLERYNEDYAAEQYFARIAEERAEEFDKELKDIEDWLKDEGEKTHPIEAEEEHINNLIKQYEAEFKAEDKQPTPTSEGEVAETPSSRTGGEEVEKGNKGLGDKARELAAKLRSGDKNVLPDWLQADLPKGTKKQGIDINEAFANALETFADVYDKAKDFKKAVEEAAKHITDWYKENGIQFNEADIKSKLEAEFKKQIPQEKKPLRMEEKSILNRIFNSDNISKEVKDKFKDSLKYKVASQEEARSIAREVISEYGIEDAVALAEAGKFNGDVNSMIFGEALDNLVNAEAKAKTRSEKKALAEQWADIAIRFDETARDKGRFISAISDFYKKSPLGIKIVEKRRRDDAFRQWFERNGKPYRDVFEEIVNAPEFKDIVREEVQTELKKERVEYRAKRRKNIEDFFDKAKFKGDATYATIIPPQVINGGLEVMKQAFLAGESALSAVEVAVKHISEKIGDDWDKDRFQKEYEEKLKSLDGGKKKEIDITEDKKIKLLDRFRKKLKGLTDSQKEEVIRKAFKKLVENGALEFEDFKKIIEIKDSSIENQ